MPPSSTGRRPKLSDNGPMTNWPTPKPIRNADSTICRRLATSIWNAEPISGSAGSIMSIASGLSDMMVAITTTNSAKPIGRCLDTSRYSASTSATKGHLSLSAIVFVFKRVLPSVLRCTTPVSGWLVGGLRHRGRPAFRAFGLRDRFAGGRFAVVFATGWTFEIDDTSRNENGVRSVAIDGVRAFGPRGFTRRTDLELPASARRDPRHLGRDPQPHRIGAGARDGGEGETRSWRPRLVQYAHGTLARRTRRGEHRLRLRQFREDARPVDRLERAPQEPPASQSHPHRRRKRQGRQRAPHLLGDGDRRRLRTAAVEEEKAREEAREGGERVAIREAQAGRQQVPHQPARTLHLTFSRPSPKSRWCCRKC